MLSFWLITISIKGMTFTSNGNYGSYNVTLTKDQMPSHTHGIKERVSSTLGDYQHGPHMSANNGRQVIWADSNTPITAIGGGKSHANIQPSKGVYYWRRTA